MVILILAQVDRIGTYGDVNRVTALKTLPRSKTLAVKNKMLMLWNLIVVLPRLGR